MRGEFYFQTRGRGGSSFRDGGRTSCRGGESPGGRGTRVRVELRVEWSIDDVVSSQSGIRARDPDHGEFICNPILKDTESFRAWRVKMENFAEDQLQTLLRSLLAKCSSSPSMPHNFPHLLRWVYDKTFHDRNISL